MSGQANPLVDNLTELAYSRFASHYSRRNWMANEPLYAQLPSKDREFWKALIVGIKTNFKPDVQLSPERCDPVPAKLESAK